MLFDLPTPDKLTEEQKNLIGLNLDSPERKGRGENLVVQGFAGTGKTVVAYYRALRAERQGKEVLVLCFGKVLRDLLLSEKTSTLKSIKHADGLYTEIKKEIKDSKDQRGNARLTSETRYGYKKLPAINIQNKSFLTQLFKEYKRIKGYNENQSIYSEIIIDEGQDLSKDVLEALKVLTDHISIFADDNQGIFDEDKNTTVNEMKEIFCPNGKVEYLTANFRTTKQICLFAAEKFLPENEKVRAIGESKTCVDDPESEPQLFGANAYSKIGLEEFLGKFVKKQWVKYDSILIVAPRTENVDNISITLSKKEIPHSVYHSNLNHNMMNKLSPFADFNLISNDKSGILVTTYHSSKGLEADCVFIYMPKTEYQKTQGDKKNIFYVLSTRAKKKLFIITDF